MKVFICISAQLGWRKLESGDWRQANVQLSTKFQQANVQLRTKFQHGPSGDRSQALKGKAIFVLQFLFFPSILLGLSQIPNGWGLPHVYAPILTYLQWCHSRENQRFKTFSDYKSQPCLLLCGLRTIFSFLRNWVFSGVGLLMLP